MPSEANQSLMQVVETQKIKYIDEYNQFCEMRLMERLAGNTQFLNWGTGHISDKLQLIDNFNLLLESM